MGSKRLRRWAIFFKIPGKSVELAKSALTVTKKEWLPLPRAAMRWISVCECLNFKPKPMPPFLPHLDQASEVRHRSLSS